VSTRRSTRMLDIQDVDGNARKTPLAYSGDPTV
jgi:hypothetical protein